jgi:hypothetical protein
MSASVQRLETCRRETLRYLYGYSAAAMKVPAITAFLVSDGHDFTAEEITAALAYLLSDQLVTKLPTPFSGLFAYQITAAGSRVFES